MRSVLEPAFVLHRRPYQNTSLLLEVLTQEHGRLGLLARGVRTARSRLKGLLQPFVPLLLSWSGKGELPTVGTAEETGLPIPLPPTRLLSGLYVNELLVRLLPRQVPHPGLFQPYREVLEALAAGTDEACALRIFEKRLLAELGYGLLLDAEVSSGAPIVSEGAYRYVLDQGPIAAERTGAGVVISGKSLLALRHEAFEAQDPAVLREVKRLTRMAIDAHLQGRRLKVREIAAGYRRGPRNDPAADAQDSGPA